MTALFSFLVFRTPKLKLTIRIEHTHGHLFVPPLAFRRTVLTGVLIAVTILLLSGCSPRSLGSSTKGWSPAVAGGGMVYVATQDGELKALSDNGSDGVRLEWTFSGEEGQLQGVFNTPVVGSSLVYFSGHGKEDGTLFAIDKDSGSLSSRSWTKLIGASGDNQRQHLVAGPALDESLGVVIVGSEDGNVYAYNAVDGEELWRFAAQDKIWTTPVIDDGKVYFGSHDHNVYAVDALTGEEKWRFATGGTVVARPLVSKGLVVIGSFDRKLYALDADDGTEVWRFEGSNNWYWAGAVASNSAIYAASMDGNVYAVDWSGNFLWEHQTGSPIVSTPVLLPSGLVVASSKGKISLLNPTPGDIGLAREISSLSLNPANIKAPVFALPVDDDNLSQTGIQADSDDQRESVFIGTQDNTVRRIQVKSGQTLVWCFNMEEDAVCK